MKTERYIAALEKIRLLIGRNVVWSDQSPLHTSNLARECYQHLGLNMLPWAADQEMGYPSRSPDLACIENLIAEVETQHAKVSGLCKKSTGFCLKKMPTERGAIG